MALTFNVYIEDIDVWHPEYDKVRLYAVVLRPLSVVLIAEQDLVEDQRGYTFTLQSAPEADVYQYSLYNSTTTIETQRWTLPGYGYWHLSRIRFEAATRGGAAMRGIASPGYPANQLQDDALRDGGSDAWFARGAWVFRPFLAEDRVRRTVSFDPELGIVTLSRDYSIPFAEGERYELYGLLPPERVAGAAYSWTDAVNDALRELWYEDDVILSSVNDNLRAYGITAPEQVKGVWLERATGERLVLGRQSTYFEVWQSSGDVLQLRTWPTPLDTDVIHVQAYFSPSPLYDEGDVPPIEGDIVAWAALLKAYEYLNTHTEGVYDRAMARAQVELSRRYQRPSSTLAMW